MFMFFFILINSLIIFQYEHFFSQFYPTFLPCMKYPMNIFITMTIFSVFEIIINFLDLKLLFNIV